MQEVHINWRERIMVRHICYGCGRAKHHFPYLGLCSMCGLVKELAESNPDNEGNIKVYDTCRECRNQGNGVKNE